MHMKPILSGFFYLAIFGRAFGRPALEGEPALEARQAPPANEVTIEGITWNGSGCTTANAKGALSDDRKMLKLLFSDYTAKIGGNAKPGDANRNCYITIKLRIPQGWSVALNSIEYQSSFVLDAGVTATQTMAYYFTPPGRSRQLMRSFTWEGPQDTATRMGTEWLGEDELLYSPCGKGVVLNIETQLSVSRLSGSSGAGLITTGEAGNWGMSWRPC